MNVEDLLDVIAQRQYDLSLGEWELGFIESVSRYSYQGKALSTKQGETVLKLGKKYKDSLFKPSSTGYLALTNLLARPTYRHEPFVSEQYPKEVRHVGDNLLAFRFKMNEVIKRDIKALAARSSMAKSSPAVRYSRQHRLWLVPVSSGNVERVQKLIVDHEFGFDDGVASLIAEIINGRGKRAQAVYDQEEKMMLVVVPDDDVMEWFAETVLAGEVV